MSAASLLLALAQSWEELAASKERVGDRLVLKGDVADRVYGESTAYAVCAQQARVLARELDEAAAKNSLTPSLYHTAQSTGTGTCKPLLGEPGRRFMELAINGATLFALTDAGFAVYADAKAPGQGASVNGALLAVVLDHCQPAELRAVLHGVLETYQEARLENPCHCKPQCRRCQTREAMLLVCQVLESQSKERRHYV